MRWAIPQLFSSSYAVNKLSWTAYRISTTGPVTHLRNRVWSHISSRSATLPMKTISCPRALILKMEPTDIQQNPLAIILGGHLPNCLASLFSEFHVSLGFTSKTLPKSGTPGGPGIGVGMALETRGYHIIQQLRERNWDVSGGTGGKGHLNAKCQMPTLRLQLDRSKRVALQPDSIIHQRFGAS